MVGFLTVLNVATAADLKIGVVDLKKLLTQSPQAERLGNKLLSEFQRRDQDLLA